MIMITLMVAFFQSPDVFFLYFHESEEFVAINRWTNWTIPTFKSHRPIIWISFPIVIVIIIVIPTNIYSSSQIGLSMADGAGAHRP